MTNAKRPAQGTGSADASASLGPNTVHDLSAALNGMLADIFDLNLKMKNFH